jgi:hypothetical protein
MYMIKMQFMLQQFKDILCLFSFEDTIILKYIRVNEKKKIVDYKSRGESKLYS